MCVFHSFIYILLSSFAFNIHMFGKGGRIFRFGILARINIWDVQTITRPRAIQTIRRVHHHLAFKYQHNVRLYDRAKSIIDHYSPLNERNLYSN